MVAEPSNEFRLGAIEGVKAAKGTVLGWWTLWEFETGLELKKRGARPLSCATAHPSMSDEKEIQDSSPPTRMDSVGASGGRRRANKAKVAASTLRSNSWWR